MTNTTERKQIVAWLREIAFQVNDGKDHGKRDPEGWIYHKAYRTAAACIERGDHLKETD